MAITLNNRALITIYGGSGFIGRHVVRAIAKTGARMRHRGQASRARRPPSAARRRGPDQRRAGQCALSRFAARRGRRRRCRRQSRRHFVSVRQADLQIGAGRRRASMSQRPHARPARARWCMCRRSAPAPTRHRSMRAARRPARTRSNRSTRTRSFCGRPSCSGLRTISSTASRRSRASRPRCR